MIYLVVDKKGKELFNYLRMIKLYLKMNATIMPNEFRGKIQECNDLIEKANITLGNPDENGKYCPITFYEDFDSLQNELAEAIGKVKFLKETLKDNTKKAVYTEVIEKMEETRNEIQEKRKKFNMENVQAAVEITKMRNK